MSLSTIVQDYRVEVAFELSGAEKCQIYSASVLTYLINGFLFAFADTLLFRGIQLHCAFLLLLFGESLATQLSIFSFTSLKALTI